MTKRIVLLAGIALIAILSVAPDAMATHCFRCKFYMGEGEWDCLRVSGPHVTGREFCDEGGSWCETYGAECVPHTASAAPLASEYTVASVERLDEPATEASGTLVAQTRTAEPLTR